MKEDRTVRPGDYVRVVDLDDPYSDFVSFVTDDVDGRTVIGLSDGTWRYEYEVIKYKAQGEERDRLMERLNDIYI